MEGYLTIKVPRPAPKKPKVKKNAAAADGLVDVADLRVPAPPPQRLASGFISLDSGSEEETGGPNVGANGAKGARKVWGVPQGGFLTLNLKKNCMAHVLFGISTWASVTVLVDVLTPST